ncbi:MAG TPA: hypothetical protein VLA13_09320, partial [Massilibacterium sp.]|nr:hypothetical protein [Massilibacterium sp.]
MKLWKTVMTVAIVMVFFVLAVTYSQTSSNANDDNGNQRNNGNQRVTPGIETFMNNHLDWIQDKQVGLVTNMTGVSTELESSIVAGISAELVAEHGLTPGEYERIVEILGRAPNLVELGVFSVMWSEHC